MLENVLQEDCIFLVHNPAHGVHLDACLAMEGGQMESS